MYTCNILSSYLIYAVCVLLLLNLLFIDNVIKLTSCQIALLFNLSTYSSINFCSYLSLWLIVASEWNTSLLFLSLSLFSPFLCLCVDTVPEEVMQCPWYHLSLKLPHGDLSKWCLYLHFSYFSLWLSLIPSFRSLCSIIYLFFFLLNVTAVILEPLRIEMQALHCYKLLMSVSNPSVLTHYVGCEHLHT